MADDISRQLDDLTNLLRLVYAREIAEARALIIGDAVNAAILGALEAGWVGTSVVQRQAAAATGVSDRTVRDRLAELAAIGAIRSRGNGRAREYERSGLV